jgi:hypothetical protein
LVEDGRVVMAKNNKMVRVEGLADIVDLSQSKALWTVKRTKAALGRAKALGEGLARQVLGLRLADALRAEDSAHGRQPILVGEGGLGRRSGSLHYTLTGNREVESGAMV